MTANSQDYGKAAELAAEQYFRRQGYAILGRNIRYANGELDLVVGLGEAIIFVEVKARRTLQFGGAAYAISRHKQLRLVQLAAQYLAHHGFSHRPCRFDVILFQAETPSHDHVHHIEHAFEISGENGKW